MRLRSRIRSTSSLVGQSLGRWVLFLILVVWNFSESLFAAGGDLDPAFNPGTGANGTVFATAVQPDGKIIIGGAFTTYNGVSRNNIARLNANGSLDTTFDPGTGVHPSPMTGGGSEVIAVALQLDGGVVIGGVFASVNGVARNNIARLNNNGSVDTTFDPGSGANSTVNAVAVQPGTVVIGGAFTTYNGISRPRIARLNADGSLDTTFDPGSGASATVRTVAVQDDGKIVIGGDFTTYTGVTRDTIARLKTNGSLDSTFDPGTVNFFVDSLALQSDGKIVIGGGFDTINGTSRDRIARLNANGSLDTSFDPGAGANGAIFSVIVQGDGRIVLGGGFATFNGTAHNYITRLNADGSLDSTFNPGTGANTSVYSVAVQGDGRIVLGGSFTAINGVTRNSIGRLLPAPGVLSFSASTNTVSEGAALPR